MKKEKCIYDNKTLANHNCDICNAPFCSFCGYVYPAPEIKDGKVIETKEQKHFCNECWKEQEIEIMTDYDRYDGDILNLEKVDE